MWLKEDLILQKGRFLSEKPMTYCGNKCLEVRNDINPKDLTQSSGFSLNPGLRRRNNYLLVAPFSKDGHEREIEKKHCSLGFRAIALVNPAIRHIGKGHYVIDPTIRAPLLKNILVRAFPRLSNVPLRKIFSFGSD